jgi:hypothetical protein
LQTFVEEDNGCGVPFEKLKAWVALKEKGYEEEDTFFYTHEPKKEEIFAEADFRSDFRIGFFFTSLLSLHGVGIKYALSRMAKDKTEIIASTKRQENPFYFQLRWEKGTKEKKKKNPIEHLLNPVEHSGAADWRYKRHVISLNTSEHWTKLLVAPLEPKGLFLHSRLKPDAEIDIREDLRLLKKHLARVYGFYIFGYQVSAVLFTFFFFPFLFW